MDPKSSIPTKQIAELPREIDQRRRRLITELPLLAVVGSAALFSSTARAASMNPIEQSLENSKTQKKGVTVMFGSGSVGMLVTEIADGYVIGRSQQYERIVVRLDRIDAVTY